MAQRTDTSWLKGSTCESKLLMEFSQFQTQHESTGQCVCNNKILKQTTVHLESIHTVLAPTPAPSLTLGNCSTFTQSQLLVWKIKGDSGWSEESLPTLIISRPIMIRHQELSNKKKRGGGPFKTWKTRAALNPPTEIMNASTKITFTKKCNHRGALLKKTKIRQNLWEKFVENRS